jgi:hypothetical protein
MSKPLARLGLAFVLAATAACSPWGANTSTANARPGAAGEHTSAPTEHAGVTAEEQAAIGRATHALAEHLGVSESTVRPFSILAREWPDSSLGCPRPGAEYLQVVTPGYRVRLAVDNVPYDVHVAAGAAVVCERAPEGLPKPAPRGAQHFSAARLQEVERQVLLDLAGRLGVAAADVRLEDRTMRTWPDPSLGCPEPGRSYPRSATSGFVLYLRHGERKYTYHTDLDRFFPCPPIAAE